VLGKNGGVAAVIVGARFVTLFEDRRLLPIRHFNIGVYA